MWGLHKTLSYNGHPTPFPGPRGHMGLWEEGHRGHGSSADFQPPPPGADADCSLPIGSTELSTTGGGSALGLPGTVLGRNGDKMLSPGGLFNGLVS